METFPNTLPALSEIEQNMLVELMHGLRARRELAPAVLAYLELLHPQREHQLLLIVVSLWLHPTSIPGVAQLVEDLRNSSLPPAVE